MITDANGKRWMPLRGKGELYKLRRIEHPDWSHRQCALAVGVPEKQADTMAWKWERNPEIRKLLHLLGNKDESKAFDKRSLWEAKTERLVDRAADAGDYGPALSGMRTLGQAAGLLVERQAPLASGDTYNTLIVGELKKQFTIDELRAMAAQLKGSV